MKSNVRTKKFKMSENDIAVTVARMPLKVANGKMSWEVFAIICRSVVTHVNSTNDH